MPVSVTASGPGAAARSPAHGRGLRRRGEEGLRGGAGRPLGLARLAQWTEVFSGVDACVTPVIEALEVVDEPHLNARGTFTNIAGVFQPAPAPRFSRTPAASPTPPVSPGADTGARPRALAGMSHGPCRRPPRGAEPVQGPR